MEVHQDFAERNGRIIGLGRIQIFQFMPVSRKECRQRPELNLHAAVPLGMTHGIAKVIMPVKLYFDLITDLRSAIHSRPMIAQHLER